MFASPKWTANLMWVTLCSLLGMILIGSFVIVGYQMEIIERRSRGGENIDVDFDPNRFVDYLVRGVIPAAIYFAFTMALSAMTSLVACIAVGVFQLINGRDSHSIANLFALLPLLALVFFHVCGVLLIALPLAMRGGLANDISEGFNLKWAFETAKFMWPTILLSVLYTFFCGLLSSVGLVFCFVGILVTGAWLQLAIADLGTQLYDIYLSKGGQPIEPVVESSVVS